jgi:hypothetical protein
MTKEGLFVEAVKSCEYRRGAFKDDLERGVECIAFPTVLIEEVLNRYSAFTARGEAVNVAMGEEFANSAKDRYHEIWE